LPRSLRGDTESTEVVDVARFSRVTRFDLPSETRVGTRTLAVAEGELFTQLPPEAPNFAVGIFYIEGPADKVVFDGYEVPRGGGVAVIIKREDIREIPFRKSLEITLILRVEGEYVFAAVTGYVVGDTFYYDDLVRRRIVAKPEEKKIEEWSWVPIAIGAGVAGLVIVAVAIAVEERRREEMMLMMLRK
jgi:hypothetical protein